MIWICIGIVVIFLVLYLVLQIQVKGKLMAYFQNGNYAAFEKCLNQTLTKIVIPAYNIEFMRLNALISQKRKKEVERQLDKLFKAKKSKDQLFALYQTAMSYYVEQEDSRKCHSLLNEMKNKSINDKIIHEAECTVDILVDNKWNHIEEIEAKLEDATDEQKKVYYYLLQRQYEASKNFKKANEYQELLNQEK